MPYHIYPEAAILDRVIINMPTWRTMQMLIFSRELRFLAGLYLLL